MIRQARTRFLWAMVSTLLVAALVPNAVSAGTRPLRFDVELGQSCIGGRAGNGTSVDLVWRAASGELKGATTVETNEFGHFLACFGDDPMSGFDPDLFVEVGDRLRGTTGSESRTFRIPLLTLRIDRVADAIHGRAPAGTRVILHYATGLFSDFLLREDVTADANGRYDFEPGFDIIGGMPGSLAWKSGDRDRVRINGEAPWLSVDLGGSRFRGFATPLRDIAVVLRDASLDVKAVGFTASDPRGDFGGRLRDGQGDPESVAAGDNVSAPDVAVDAEWNVPQVNASVNTTTEVVKGRCFDAGTSSDFYRIVVRAPDGRTRGFAIGETTPAGHFEVDFSGDPGIGFDPANIRPGDMVTIGCLQGTGDWVQRTIVGT